MRTDKTVLSTLNKTREATPRLLTHPVVTGAIQGVLAENTALCNKEGRGHSAPLCCPCWAVLTWF